MTARLGFFNVAVDNMAQSLTFYEHLGFKFSPEQFGEGHVESELLGGLKMAWTHIDYIRIYAPDYEPAAHGRVGLSFELDTPDDVDSLFTKLQMLGYKCDRTPWSAPWGHRYAIVYDPDGNVINLYSPET